MAYSELHWTQKFTQKPVSSKDYFNGLKKKMRHDAYWLAKARAEKMRNTLVFRKNLGGAWGQYPKWDWSAHPNLKNPRKSKSSFAGWKVVRKEAGVYVLRNDVTNDNAGRWSGYSYVKNLANGTGWNSATMESTNLKRLVRRGNKLFSKQMPFGLAPWLREQRNQLKQDIKKNISKGGIK